MKQQRSLLEVFVIFIFLGLGFINPANVVDIVFGIFLLLYTGLIATNRVNNFFLKPAVQIFPLIIFFVISSYITSQSIVKYLGREPLVETYRSDLDDFLRTYYLMEHGKDYYTAFSQAVAENAFKGYVAHNLFAWRLPTIFYFWKWLPGNSGVGIFYAFIGISISIFLSIFYITRIFLSENKKQFAILAPYLLYPYLHFGVRDTLLLHTEWWGLATLLLGLFFLLKHRNFFAIIFFLLTLVIRELYIIPILLLSGILFIHKRSEWKIGLVCVLGWLSFMFSHAYFVSQITEKADTFLSARTHAFSVEIIRSTLAFGAGEYLFYRLRIFALSMVCGLVGVIISKNLSVKLLLSFLLFPLTFLFIGSGVYNDYWGIFYVPFIMMATPVFISLIK